MILTSIITMAILTISCTAQSCESNSDRLERDAFFIRRRKEMEFEENCREIRDNYKHDHGRLAIAIGRATHLHLDQISKLSDIYYQNFKKSLYSRDIPSSWVNDFVEKTAKFNKKKNEEFTYVQLFLNKICLHPDKDKRVLVAIAKKWGWGPVFGPDSGISGNIWEDVVVGYCRFEKKDPQTIYIDFVLVTEEFRDRGIANLLIQEAMNTFDEITQCTFHVPENDIPLNDLFLEKGCKKINTVHLDPNTGEISINPNRLPIAYNNYSYAIKK